MDTISFDFDGTLWNEDESFLIPESLQLLGDFLRKGHRVIVVTARGSEWIPECRSALDRCKLHSVEVFSAPAAIGEETATEKTKSTILVAQGAVIHFDDIPDDSALLFAIESGISVVDARSIPTFNR